MIIDGYEYKLGKRKENSTTWRCTQQNKHKCRVTALTTGNQIQIKAIQHNHSRTSLTDTADISYPKKLLNVVYTDKFII